MNIVPNALLYKQKRFRFIAMRNLCVQGSVGTIAVIAALSGAGIYALLINPIVSSIVLFIVNLREHPLRVRWTAGLQPLRTIFAFSAYQFSFNVINYFTRNLDKLLIGKYMGMSPLGFYEKSYRLMMLPLQNITNIISPVMHPISPTSSTTCASFRNPTSKWCACWPGSAFRWRLSSTSRPRS